MMVRIIFRWYNFVSKNRQKIANFPKFLKIPRFVVDWNFNQCFMQNTNFEFFTNITTQRFYFRKIRTFSLKSPFFNFCRNVSHTDICCRNPIHEYQRVQQLIVLCITIFSVSPFPTGHYFRCKSK